MRPGLCELRSALMVVEVSGVHALPPGRGSRRLTNADDRDGLDGTGALPVPGVHDPLDELLHAPGTHSIALLDRERMVRSFQLDVWARGPGAHLNHGLEELRIGVTRYRGAEPAEELRAARPSDLVEHLCVSRKARPAEREPHTVAERLTVSVDGDLQTAAYEEPLIIDDAGIIRESRALCPLGFGDGVELLPGKLKVMELHDA